MVGIDVSGGVEHTLRDAVVLERLPAELLEVVGTRLDSKFLDAIAEGSLDPALTLRFLVRFLHIFADICARWVSIATKDQRRLLHVVASFARILPYAPHLSVFLKYLLLQSGSGPVLRTSVCKRFPYLSTDSIPTPESLSLTDLQVLLLTVFRLLRFRRSAFAAIISTSRIQRFSEHSDGVVRYLAIHILCILLSASDGIRRRMLSASADLGSSLQGAFDGEVKDYEFLELHERECQKTVEHLRLESRDIEARPSAIASQCFSPYVTWYGGVLLPQLHGHTLKKSAIVATRTALENMRSMAAAALSFRPLLVYGLPSSGKTAFVNDLARVMAKDSSLVTLHLNEQTDAKSLIGLYTVGSQQGSFSWRPGILTTAIQEGRWILIEDLDRAPTELISILLPLIEKGELFIPSRGECVKAADGFKIIATVQSVKGNNGQELMVSPHLMGVRLWNQIQIRSASWNELAEIVVGQYPVLEGLLPNIMGVFRRLSTPSKPSTRPDPDRLPFAAVNSRHLLRWCRRLERHMSATSLTIAPAAVSQAVWDKMFLESIDCFASNLPLGKTRTSLIFAVAEELHMSPQTAEYYSKTYIPRYELDAHGLTIGRIHLKRKASGASVAAKLLQPFAPTRHAKRLMEQIAVAVELAEPLLLVGETGIGKTAVIQQLARDLGHRLTVINLSQQSEAGDLLGGFKPVSTRSIAIPLKDEFDLLLSATGLSVGRNQKYIEQLGKCVAKGHWSKASKLWHEGPRMYALKLSDMLTRMPVALDDVDGEQWPKRRKLQSRRQILEDLEPRWAKFVKDLERFDQQLRTGKSSFIFNFVEGAIVKAARNGGWVLLDEINLASPDTLESIADLLCEGPDRRPSILLSETGEVERVLAHPDFRIFGAMNPATDVGKHDLAPGLRSRFTEIYVNSPDQDMDDLLEIVRTYLRDTSINDERLPQDIAHLYLDTKRLATENRIVDGANQIPHFSLRTLTRALMYAVELAHQYGLRRAFYDGFSMCFLTLLNADSESMLVPLMHHHLLRLQKDVQAFLNRRPLHPNDGKQYIKFASRDQSRQYWILKGREETDIQHHYVITPFVMRNMLNLVRASSTRRFPILIQGPTSSGKTSMIEYLAKYSGNQFVRINNHEHTDLQEYLGTYVAGTNGQLHFQDGILVRALREGHWLVLDELNLAPTDVLEALNRLLDDNRELLVTETQEIVRPHPNFMLFATQNPAGLYGGRKMLSRAFRNRFLELHFDDIPDDELETILQNRARNVAPSDCRRIVAVYKELSRVRQSSRLFEQSHSFATLRDLFRWALRDAENRDQLAVQGYMLLGERVRDPGEVTVVKDVIEDVMRVRIDPTVLYMEEMSSEIQLYQAQTHKTEIVWTASMKRLFILVARALRKNEPVLLVGETGCGKTSVCHMLAETFGKTLHTINAHQNTETGDLVGAQRPLRNREATLHALKHDLRVALIDLDIIRPADGQSFNELSAMYRSLEAASLEKIPSLLRQRIQTAEARVRTLFEWSDGTLVQAMKTGQYFLLDEISLADDSVLERLNSVLESQRSLLLAEKGVDDSFVQAADGFQFLATMNPGGDFGKKELSPALRNRFTEIWVPALTDREDLILLVGTKLALRFKPLAEAIVDFATWFGKSYRTSAAQNVSVRDVLAWVTFINECCLQTPIMAVLHGAAMVYIDTLGANPAGMFAIHTEHLVKARLACLQQLSTLVLHDMLALYSQPIDFDLNEEWLRFGAFSLPRMPRNTQVEDFIFQAPTTRINAMRVVRALQIKKPILLEGSPGVGKTTLIAALASVTGHALTRINLSEQTDLMDLFGSDIPTEGETAGNFSWRDAPFLRAMQRGDWVLLDEMNLASQSILEGLNACLDHRGEIFITELDRTFQRHPDFKLFAAQNPHHEGGGRKGLPSSFVNRFTVVYADVFNYEDLMLICKHTFKELNVATVSRTVSFVKALEHDVVLSRNFGMQGAPWEFNLRDVLRWQRLMTTSEPTLAATMPVDFLNMLFRQRFRSLEDRVEVDMLFARTFGTGPPHHSLYHSLTPDTYQVGRAILPRHALSQRIIKPKAHVKPLLAELESIMLCVQNNLPCILVGSSGSGKSFLVEHLAATVGANLTVFSMNADIDTMDLVGGFEQVDSLRQVAVFKRDLRLFLETTALSVLPGSVPEDILETLSCLEDTEPISRHLEKLLHQLKAIRESSQLLEVDNYVVTCESLLEHAADSDGPSFQWVDGLLIQALEQGDWIVLDNANLCSPAVFDRLNSLLEHRGTLVINEHCDQDGTPRTIVPHINFRLFMTMDARFGELSRAVRNRAVEICLLPEPPPVSGKSHCVSNHDEASGGFELVCRVLEAGSDNDAEYVAMLRMALDNLSSSALTLLPRFTTSIVQGLRTPSHWISKDIVEDLFRHYFQISEDTSFPIMDEVQHFNATMTAFFNLPASFEASQPINTLNNPSLVSLSPRASRHAIPYILAVLVDKQLDLRIAEAALVLQHSVLTTAKVTEMNRLQRSMASPVVAAVLEDSTKNAFRFLQKLLALSKNVLLSSYTNAEAYVDVRDTLGAILTIWWQTFRLCIDRNFDETTFQAHLAIARETLLDRHRRSQLHAHNPTSIVIHDCVEEALLVLDEAFHTGFRLTKGLSLEKLWLQLKPLTVSDESAFACLSDLYRLMNRFDALKWRLPVSCAELTSISSAFARIMRIVLTTKVDAAQLLKALTVELENLESRITSKSPEFKPVLNSQTEILRQYQVLRSNYGHVDGSETGTQEFDPKISIMADCPTALLSRTTSSSSTSALMQSIDHFWGREGPSGFLRNAFSVSLFIAMQKIENVDLRSLKFLDDELPIFGAQLAHASDNFSLYPSLKLNELLFRLIMDIIRLHGNNAGRQIEAWYEDLRVLSERQGADAENFRDHCKKSFHFVELMCEHDINFREILSTRLMPALIDALPIPAAARDHLTCSARAWIGFAHACIELYVPDKPLDPVTKLWLQHHNHSVSVTEKQQMIAGMRKFEALFTGQTSSLRIQLAEAELVQLEASSNELYPIFRPQSTNLIQLQGEFSALHHLLTETDTMDVNSRRADLADDSVQNQSALLHINLEQIVSRLLGNYQAYQDLTLPVVNMIRSLQIGLSMAQGARCRPSAAVTSEATNMTPFLGGRLSQDLSSTSTNPLLYLAKLSMISTIEGEHHLRREHRSSLINILQECYLSWEHELEIRQQQTNSKSNLYRYRGAADDEDAETLEELQDLFPTFDSVNPTSTPISETSDVAARNLAILVAGLHEQIIFAKEQKAQQVLRHIKVVCKHLGKELAGSGQLTEVDENKAMLPGVLLMIFDRIESLTMQTIPDTELNFYADANLPASRKALDLVCNIQKRYRALQEIDEIAHMQPLEDVLLSCDRFLSSQYDEPLAKLISKVENLHTHMHEWQFGGWASQANSALSLYDEVTNMIISWRRQELATWAKLFDMEDKKCEENAMSWWFVAYKIVVAVPMTMMGNEAELRKYTLALLQDLETYISTSSQGEFSARLRLLKQLQLHLHSLAKESQGASIVAAALGNFIDFYQWFEKPVVEALKHGKTRLEKSIKEVILLASWKDTNIVALRDSARRSHHKLFKVVKQYRSLLAQPVGTITSGGIPGDFERLFVTEDFVKPGIGSNSGSNDAIEICRAHVPRWDQKGKRLIDVFTTSKLMEKMASFPDSAIPVSTYLDSFVADLARSIGELQKATPRSLTEDNELAIKHLKTRKRKLFADTLRSLKQMGIKHNLGSKILGKQASSSIILGNAPMLPANSTDRASLQHFFHRAIDLMPRARSAAIKHSQDLTSAESNRSVGVLEGCLQLIIHQRLVLVRNLEQFASLGQSVAYMQTLWSPEMYTILPLDFSSDYALVSKWIPTILQVTIELLQKHSKLTGQKIEILTGRLEFWLQRFNGWEAQISRLPDVPCGITTTLHTDVLREFDIAVNSLDMEMNEAAQKDQSVGYILQQIQLWTKISHEQLPPIPRSGSLSELDDKLSTTCDLILVAVEHSREFIQQMPSSTEDLMWLQNAAASLENVLDGLHVGQVVSQLLGNLQELHKIDLADSTTSKVAAAMFCSTLPIVNQYLLIFKRHIDTFSEFHRASCRMTSFLMSVYKNLAAQGFCTPAEKPSGGESNTQELESGTGLGEAEGEEDISKDIQEDEDLSELAQEPKQDKDRPVEDEKDAVDMADAEMEGDIGSAEEKDEEEVDNDGSEKSEIEDETGQVDDLDPTAVDEKKWDGDGEKAEKDQEGDSSKGVKDKDEEAAAADSNTDKTGNDSSHESEADAEEIAGVEQAEDVQQEELNKHDTRAPDEETLDLPEDMKLDGGDGHDESQSQVEDQSEMDGDHDDYEDVNDAEIPDMAEDDQEITDREDDNASQNGIDHEDVADQEHDMHDTDEGAQQDELPENSEMDIDQDGLLRDKSDENANAADEQFSANVQGTGDNQDERQTSDTLAAVERDDASSGVGGDESNLHEGKSAEEGEQDQLSRGDNAQDHNRQTPAAPTPDHFRRLGDILEQWHRQHKDLQAASSLDEEHDAKQVQENEEAFQHLQDENAEADTQALGTATAEEAHVVDESMAIDAEAHSNPETRTSENLEEDQETTSNKQELVGRDTSLNDDKSADPGEAVADGGKAVAENQDTDSMQTDDAEEEAVEEVDEQLASTHIAGLDSHVYQRTQEEARKLWMTCEAATGDLSLSLTEQLRLILAPTLATKMRGDFRTGKRLNIRRIIPYIASQYKRDKIWMRRSMPSKRSYQILLAVDDSRSMGASGSGNLALETLVMVSKSLSMLEVGEIGIVGFGREVNVVHEFHTPFTSDAGAQLFQEFGFGQTQTDVVRLVRESIDLFRTARARVFNNRADLWQLELIISDGVCDSSEHEQIRRLLREATMEHIMMVFIIVDDSKKKKRGERVLDLKEARFVKDEATGASNVKIVRYLDTFPFQYYLIVKDVRELPGVLATLLRQWFAEVSDA